jgi:hypothetical protein
MSGHGVAMVTGAGRGIGRAIAEGGALTTALSMPGTPLAGASS